MLLKNGNDLMNFECGCYASFSLNVRWHVQHYIADDAFVRNRMHIELRDTVYSLLFRGERA